MKMNYEKGYCELVVSTYMMCVLCLFNDANALSFSDIKLNTMIEESYLKQTLFSLVHSKLLKKQNAGSIIQDDDVFSVNEQFKPKGNRMKIPVLNYEKTSR